MSRSRLILNPSSGTDKASGLLPSINQSLRERFGMMEIVMTAGPRDAEEAAAQAVRDGCARVFVAGGDGTLNEVVNGLMSAGALDRVPVGLLPLGTGNDFARMLHLAEEPEQAMAALYDAREISVDVGTLNGRAFINASGGGFIAEVSGAVDDRLKSIAGKLAFLIGGAQVVLDYEPAAVRISVPAGGFGPCSFETEADAGEGEGWRDAGDVRVLETRLHMYAICNARLIGGGRLIAPHARIDDGWLDVCLVDEMPTVEFIALLAKVAAGGAHLADPRVRYFRVREMEMAFDRPVNVNTDGELLTAEVCRYRVMPGAARFFAGTATSNS
ncbi:MAG: diacylglycerol kinase family lipid kinase [Acidobacteriota bacterium]|nr:diacylglycerol kinase family lipid kinase [Acidobacteriota bacterium]